MAKKSSGPGFFKLAMFLAAAFVVVKYGLPWFNANFKPKTSTHKSSSAGGSASPDGGDCIALAEDASSSWVSGLSSFTNPPYDQSEWDGFRSSIDSQISDANSACRQCGTDSCTKVQDAMSRLSGAVSSTDSAIRNNNPPPGEIIRIQESVDQIIDSAR